MFGQVDKVLDKLSVEDTNLRVLSLEGNHLLALPTNFDFQVRANLEVVVSQVNRL